MLREIWGFVGNYADMLGYGSNDGMKEYLRLYISLHGDHEGTFLVFSSAS